jgi:hypothetical protein
MPFECNGFIDGFKYLGFPLKPNEYGKNDWEWLVEKN